MRFDNTIPRYQGNVIVNSINGDNSYIIKTINDNIGLATFQTQKLSKQFAAQTVLQVAKNIFSFLQQLPYIPDAEGIQDIKAPSAFIALGGDCKSFALFTAGILNNLGIKNGLRYASYDTDATPTHVYNFAIDSQGNEIVIDRVFCHAANTEMPYKHKKDYVMQIRTISGYSNAQINGRLGDALKKVGNTVVGAVKEIVPDKVEKFVQDKLIDPAKVVGLAIPRTAFIALVDVNTRFLATKMQEMINKGGESKLRATWEGLGGDYGKLKDAINIGSRKKGLFGFINSDGGDLQLIQAFNKYGGNVSILNRSLKRSIAGEPVTAATVTTVIASATPVLIAVVKALKEGGISVDEAANLANEAGNTFTSITGNDVGSTIFVKDSNNAGLVNGLIGLVPAALAKNIPVPSPANPQNVIVPPTPVISPANPQNIQPFVGYPSAPNTTVQPPNTTVQQPAEREQQTYVAAAPSGDTPKKDNTMLYLIGGGLALLFLLKK